MTLAMALVGSFLALLVLVATTAVRALVRAHVLLVVHVLAAMASLAVGAWILLGPRPDLDALRSTTCTVVEHESYVVEVNERLETRWNVRVRWTLDGATYTLFEPLPAPPGADASMGGRIPCAYRAGDPTRIALFDVEVFRRRRFVLGIGFVAGAILLVGFEIEWRRRRRRTVREACRRRVLLERLPRYGVDVAHRRDSVALVASLWPLELNLVPAGDAEYESGDPAFDAVWGLSGPELLRRSVPNASVRAALLALHATGLPVDSEVRIRITVPDRHVDQIPLALDALVALADALPRDDADPHATAFAIAVADPVASVRRAQYTWLVAEGWEVPRVVRAAAADPDPEIAMWARAQLPPDDGAYR